MHVNDKKKNYGKCSLKHRGAIVLESLQVDLKDAKSYRILPGGCSENHCSRVCRWDTKAFTFY